MTSLPRNSSTDRDAALNELAKALLSTDPKVKKLESENPSKAFKLALSQASTMMARKSTST